MNYILNVPGKTFLIGEYSVLVGGHALGLATAPYFELKSSLEDNDTSFLIHSQSAAGQLLTKNHLWSDNFKIDFKNKYQVGGFGASTAEFLFAAIQVQKLLSPCENQGLQPHARDNDHSIKMKLDNSVKMKLDNSIKMKLDNSIKMKLDINLAEIFTQYLSLYQNDPAKMPSGGDLVTQFLGHVTHFKKTQESNLIEIAESYAWPFQDYGFLIYSTGLKIKTHEHLNSLDRKVLYQLQNVSDQGIRVFLNSTRSGYDFLTSLKEWCSALVSQNLTHEKILELKTHLNKKIENHLGHSDYVIKPCGALGSDVILIYCKSEEKNAIKKVIEIYKTENTETSQLKYQADDHSLSEGAFLSEEVNLNDEIIDRKGLT